MSPYQKAFFALCRRGIGDEGADVPEVRTPEDWDELIKISAEQQLLPLIIDTIDRELRGKAVRTEAVRKARGAAVASVIRQITQANEFLTLLLHAQGRGLDPIVVKGIVCRSLYPVPCLRPSVDEDMLVPPEDVGRYHEFLLSEGLFADEPDLSPEERRLEYEISYHRENSPTYIELHTALFEPGSAIFSKLNELFDGMEGRTARVQIEDVSVRTLSPTDHMLFLILHAYKHFLYSGTGIRPMCDIGLFAEAYADEIDWEEVREKLASVDALYFAKAVFKVVQLHLLPGASFYARIRDWEIAGVDVAAFLADSLDGGLHGTSSLMRLHSSNITLQAVEGSGRKRGSGMVMQALRTVFLPYGQMRKKYPYLKKVPVLLPAAWVQRIVKYCLETHRNRKKASDSHVTESLRLGTERVRLLRQYKIIE